MQIKIDSDEVKKTVKKQLKGVISPAIVRLIAFLVINPSC
jgi:hypothetical protein